MAACDRRSIGWRTNLAFAVDPGKGGGLVTGVFRVRGDLKGRERRAWVAEHYRQRADRGFESRAEVAPCGEGAPHDEARERVPSWLGREPFV